MKNTKAIITILFLGLFTICSFQNDAFAQKKKKKKGKKSKVTSPDPSQMSKEMYILSTRSGDVTAQEQHITKMRKKRGKLSIAEARNQFVDQRRKEKKRIMEEMKKPQYRDPSFFGHKKKPKKRPVGKQKLCKECGIYH